jgi:hypothetical protein
MDYSVFKQIDMGTILKIVQVVKSPLVQRMLINFANVTPNKIDDMVVAAIIAVFGNGEIVNKENIVRLQTKLNDVQAAYNSMAVSARNKYKETLSVLQP